MPLLPSAATRSRPRSLGSLIRSPLEPESSTVKADARPAVRVETAQGDHHQADVMPRPMRVIGAFSP